jgi:hypothetical protein
MKKKCSFSAISALFSAASAVKSLFNRRERRVVAEDAEKTGANL